MNICPTQHADANTFQKQHDRNRLVRTALWLHDEGYCMLPRGCSNQPSVPLGQYCNQRPDRNRLVAWLNKPECSGIGIVAGAISHLVILDLDTYSSVAYLDDWFGDAAPGQMFWHKTDSGIRFWFSDRSVPKNCKMLSRDGVDLYLERQFCDCPPLPTAYAFNGPIQQPSSLPTIPPKLIEWLMCGQDRSDYSRRPPATPNDSNHLAAYFWSEPRTPIPTGRRRTTLFHVACYYLAHTNQPYRLISELVRRATQIDGITEEQAIKCCDDAMQETRLAPHKSSLE